MWTQLEKKPLTRLGRLARAKTHEDILELVRGQFEQIIQAVNKLGLAVRGLYGEGTEALGNVFQVSNQMTLGETESEIVERLKSAAVTGSSIKPAPAGRKGALPRGRERAGRWQHDRRPLL